MLDYPVPTDVAEVPSRFMAAGLDIPAALTLPTNRPPHSAVLLIPGSLFADVNGDYPSWNSFPGANVSLAHQLAERGHAVFRFAKSGPGTGTEVRDATIAARNRTWDGRVVIAECAFQAMRNALRDAGIQDTVPQIIGGHSEGAVVALRLAQRVANAGVISLAGPAVGILEIMREMNARMHAPDKLAVIMPALDAVITAIRNSEPIPDELKRVEGVGGLATMPPDGLQYMRESDATNPVTEASKLAVPLLVVQGTADVNVPAEHGARLSAAARNSELLLVEGVSHFFKMVPEGTDGMQAFGWPGACDVRVANGIDRWLRHL